VVVDIYPTGRVPGSYYLYPYATRPIDIPNYSIATKDNTSIKRSLNHIDVTYNISKG